MGNASAKAGCSAAAYSMTISPVMPWSAWVLPSAAPDAAAQIAGAARRDRHHHHSADCARIDLDLADRALELGERHRFAVALLRHLHLAGLDHLRERMRGEVVRIVARVAQDQLVELAGLEPQCLGTKSCLPGVPRSTVTSIGVCRDRSPAASAAPDATPNSTAEPSAKR